MPSGRSARSQRTEHSPPYSKEEMPPVVICRPSERSQVPSDAGCFMEEDHSDCLYRTPSCHTPTRAPSCSLVQPYSRTPSPSPHIIVVPSQGPSTEYEPPITPAHPSRHPSLPRSYNKGAPLSGSPTVVRVPGAVPSLQPTFVLVEERTPSCQPSVRSEAPGVYHAPPFIPTASEDEYPAAHRTICPESSYIAIRLQLSEAHDGEPVITLVPSTEGGC
jgi:hypothetical protein